MAVIRDRLTGGPAARVISRLMLVIGVAPLFAPTLGGLIAGAAGWRAVFAVLAVFGVVLWIAVWRWLPETLSPDRRATAGPREAVRGYRSLLGDRQFLSLAVIPGLGMGALISYVLGSPFVLQEDFGLTAQQFALVFAFNGMALVIGAQVNAALLRRYTPIDILRVALPSVVTVALVLLGFAATGAGGVLGILAPLWLMLFLLGFIMGNASAIALSRRGDRAGTAAAVIGATQAGVAGLVSSMVGLLGGGAGCDGQRHRHVTDHGAARPARRHLRQSPPGVCQSAGARGREPADPRLSGYRCRSGPARSHGLLPALEVDGATRRGLLDAEQGQEVVSTVAGVDRCAELRQDGGTDW